MRDTALDTQEVTVNKKNKIFCCHGSWNLPLNWEDEVYHTWENKSGTGVGYRYTH